MVKRIIICISLVFGFLQPIHATKLHTYHYENKPVKLYVIDTLGRHRNRVIVYPNSQNKGIQVTYLSERHDSFVIELPFEDEICYCDKDNLSFTLESNTKMFPYDDYSWPIALEKDQEVILSGVDKGKIYGKSILNNEEVFGWIYTSLENNQRKKSNAYSIHKNGETIVLYSDKLLTQRRLELFPYEQEGNAGIMLYINKAVENVLEIQVNDEVLYCKVGSFYTNTRNYNKTKLLLYDAPNKDSSIIGVTTIEQSALIIDVYNTWLKVKCIDDYNEPIIGWIPLSMQCPSPWTTCN